MRQPIAVSGCQHTCPIPGNPPHSGGPILPPQRLATVFVGGKPIACVGDQANCVGATDVISTGSQTVFAEGGKPVVRLNDHTIHNGLITSCASEAVQAG